MFWERLNQLINEKNITFYKVSKETGISQGTFSQWRSNPKTNPQKDLINKIAKYFNVSVDYLLGKTDERNNILNVEVEKDTTLKEPKEEYKTEPTAEIYNIYEKLDDNNKKILTDIGKTIFLYQKKNGNEW